jgi:hypothetical protein
MQKPMVLRQMMVHFDYMEHIAMMLTIQMMMQVQSFFNSFYQVPMLFSLALFLTHFFLKIYYL